MMDLVICGAIIVDHDMIEKVIASCPSYPFSKKYILFDGAPSDVGDLRRESYLAYTHYIEKKYPEFRVVRFTENVYFREMINCITSLSEAKRIFVVQDDVLCHDMDLQLIEKQMNKIEDINILCFPHKEIGYEGDHWFKPFDDTFPLPFIKCHGWSERVFIFDRIKMRDLTSELPSKGRTAKFVEAIYHKAMLSAQWSRSTDDEKELYWKQWGCYFHYDIHHTHLVGKRSVK